jgi:site-specific recombinase
VSAQLLTLFYYSHMVSSFIILLFIVFIIIIVIINLCICFLLFLQTRSDQLEECQSRYIQQRPLFSTEARCWTTALF